MKKYLLWAVGGVAAWFAFRWISGAMGGSAQVPINANPSTGTAVMPDVFNRILASLRGAGGPTNTNPVGLPGGQGPQSNRAALIGASATAFASIPSIVKSFAQLFPSSPTAQPISATPGYNAYNPSPAGGIDWSNPMVNADLYNPFTYDTTGATL